MSPRDHRIDPALASWITAPGEDPQNPLLRLSFALVSPPVSARLLVTGLGTFRAALNGAEVDDARLVLGVTASNISVLHKLPPAPVVVDERADAPADFQSVMKSLLKRSGRS